MVRAARPPMGQLGCAGRSRLHDQVGASFFFGIAARMGQWGCRTELLTSALSSPMARYFFHSQTDTRYTDTEGVEFGTPAEARKEAIRMAGEMLKTAPEPFWGSRPWNITVTDHAGLIMWELSIHGISTAASLAYD